MNRDKASEISKKAVEALKQQFPGFRIKQQGGRYSDVDFTFSVTLTEGGAESKEVRDFKSNAPYHGLKADDLYQKFTSKGQVYEIIGWLSGRDVYPVLCVREDGVRKIFTPNGIKNYLDRELENKLSKR